MAVKTRNSTKKSKASKGASSLSTKRRSSRRNISHHRAEAAEDDTSIVSDDTGSSSPSNNNILISPRENEFSERTWWMVDMFEQEDNEEGNVTTQGATALVKRCIRVYGWDLQKTRKVLSAYKQFLTLKKQYKDWDATLLSPSLLIDQMWHQHILDVVNYNHDMMLLCGHVVGHNPDGASDGKKKAERDATTRNALEQRFPNKYDKEIWGVASLKVGEESEEEESEGDSDSELLSSVINPKTKTITPNKTNLITVKVVDNQTGIQRNLSINKSARMSTLFDTYAIHRGVKVSKLAFSHWRDYSNSIDCNDTAEKLGLKTGTVIYATSSACIAIRIKDQCGEESLVRIKTTTRMGKVFKCYAHHKGVHESNLRFLLDGERICDQDTPMMLDLEDDDQIDVILVQTGC